jgi:PEP-CTERM motif
MKLSTVMRGVAVAAALASSSAFAIDCENNDVLGATACVGLFEGNANNGPAFDDVAALVESGLGLTAGSLSFSGDNSTSFSAAVGGYSTLTFSEQLFGETVIGIHWGNYTGFYLLDLAAPTYTVQVENPNGLLLASTLPSTGGGFSNGHVYSTTPPIPEPSTYALMLAGLAAVGFMARRRRQS